MEKTNAKENYLSINQIKNMVNNLLDKLTCENNESILPTYESAIGDGTPYIIVNEFGYNYIISERDVEYKRLITKEINELLFWIFKDIIYELVDKRNKDREEWFKEIEENMEKINKNWANILKEEHKKLLLGNKQQIDKETRNDTIYL